MVFRSEELKLKAIRSVQYLLRSVPAALAQSADILAESLVELTRAILSANMGDLSFLQRLNLKNVMNKSIKYSRWC